MKNKMGMDENDPDLMTPPWGCYWYGQWLGNIEFAVKQGMELMVVSKPGGQGRGELDRFPSKEDWEGKDGTRFAKDKFLGGSQVFNGRAIPSAPTDERVCAVAGDACPHAHCSWLTLMPDLRTLLTHLLSRFSEERGRVHREGAGS